MDFKHWLNQFLEELRRSGSVMSLGQDIRPMPDVAQAYQDYAAAMGKSAEDLTSVEKQQAYLTAVLAAYDDST